MAHAIRTSAQYDALADFYDRYFADKREALLRGEPLAAEVEARLAELPEKAAVLDCACGTGSVVLALAQRGYRAYGTDLSRAEIAVARRHARQFSLPARFAAAAWAELPQKVHRTFDLVLCTGNAICHCRDEREMLAALRGMFSLLKPGGTLCLDSRCWETYRKQRVRFDTFTPKLVDGERLLWLNVRHYPRRFTDEHLTEVVIISETNGNTAVHSFPVTFYPFRLADLKRRLRTAGFGQIRVTHRNDRAWYSCTAVRL